MTGRAHVGGWRRDVRRRGWCPGVLRPMETGDGLLVRLRASCGRLTLDQAETIAKAALACGNGAISLSSRANVQIRGVKESTLPDLQTRLAQAGLLDADADIERVRNIVVSPLSDFDPEAAFDLSLGVANLEAGLATDELLRDLPAKFAFVLDAGGRYGVADLEADIRFEAIREAAGPTFAVYLSGDDTLAVICARAEVGEVAVRLARAFLGSLAVALGPMRRMRSLVTRIGAAAVFAEAGFCPAHRPRAARRVSLREALGARALGAKAVVGLAAPFGAIETAKLGSLIAEAREAGAEGLRLAPWRTFFVVGLSHDRGAAFAAACAKLGFILDASDPRIRVVACPGAPACAHAHAPLLGDAERWAKLLPKGEGVILHLSGCPKGCARVETTSMTLVATERGYDVVTNGRAGDPPSHRSLSPEYVERLIVRRRHFRKRSVA